MPKNFYSRTPGASQAGLASSMRHSPENVLRSIYVFTGISDLPPMPPSIAIYASISVLPPSLSALLFLPLPSIPRLPAATAKQSQRIRRPTKAGNPVKLVFGRPDIEAYLTETFSVHPRVPGTQARRGRTTFDLGVSMSTRVTGRADELSELEVRETREPPCYMSGPHYYRGT